jgi:hypothetical protein
MFLNKKITYVSCRFELRLIATYYNSKAENTWAWVCQAWRLASHMNTGAGSQIAMHGNSNWSWAAKSAKRQQFVHSEFSRSSCSADLCYLINDMCAILQTYTIVNILNLYIFILHFYNQSRQPLLCRSLRQPGSQLQPGLDLRSLYVLHNLQPFHDHFRRFPP